MLCFISQISLSTCLNSRPKSVHAHWFPVKKNLQIMSVCVEQGTPTTVSANVADVLLKTRFAKHFNIQPGSKPVCSQPADPYSNADPFSTATEASTKASCVASNGSCCPSKTSPDEEKKRSCRPSEATSSCQPVKKQCCGSTE